MKAWSHSTITSSHNPIIWKGSVSFWNDSPDTVVPLPIVSSAYVCREDFSDKHEPLFVVRELGCILTLNRHTYIYMYQ